MKRSGIYKITCTENGHFYSGRTTDFAKRMTQHKVDLKSGKHKNIRMQHCYDKYGSDSFKYELIQETTEDINEMIEAEQNAIDEFIDLPECMNINKTAKCACYVPMTPERRRKISLSRSGKKGTPRTEEQRLHMHNKMMGHVISEETKRKISESHKGKKLSEEHKEKLRKHFSGSGNPMHGRTGDNNPHSKAVLQIDPDSGNVINRFPSQVAAAEKFGAKDGSNLGKAIRKKIKAYGFLWSYEMEGPSTIESTGDRERVE